MDRALEHPDESIWEHAETGTRMLLNATMTDAAEKAFLRQFKKSHPQPGSGGCGAMEVPCEESCSWCGTCCSLGACLAPNYIWDPAGGASEYDPSEWKVWKDDQCRNNLTCAFTCSDSPVHNPRKFAAAATEKILGLFTGGALDMRMAYDSDIAKELVQSIPEMNMTFRSLQEKYRTLATQAHLEAITLSPLQHQFVEAGVELLTAANKYLENILSVELKNVPDGIKMMVEFDNLKPFQFIFSLLDGSGILGMLTAGPPPESPVATAAEEETTAQTGSSIGADDSGASITTPLPQKEATTPTTSGTPAHDSDDSTAETGETYVVEYEKHPELNGEYVEDGTMEGKPKFKQRGGRGVIFYSGMWGWGHRWFITDKDPPSSWLSRQPKSENAPLPPEGLWRDAIGGRQPLIRRKEATTPTTSSTPALAESSSTTAHDSDDSTTGTGATYVVEYEKHPKLNGEYVEDGTMEGKPKFKQRGGRGVIFYSGKWGWGHRWFITDEVGPITVGVSVCKFVVKRLWCRMLGCSRHNLVGINRALPSTINLNALCSLVQLPSSIK
ncbi:Wrap73 [Symbiodinium natans]|uniref:Wrap73 protein n=1 Tax=Symbiodinium natans TaxID=878477 RepID=A0A812MTH4_9DINO|nr:Wrap73 [Symbiodinium natans]